MRIVKFVIIFLVCINMFGITIHAYDFDAAKALEALEQGPDIDYSDIEFESEYFKDFGEEKAIAEDTEIYNYSTTNPDNHDSYNEDNNNDSNGITFTEVYARVCIVIYITIVALLCKKMRDAVANFGASAGLDLSSVKSIQLYELNQNSGKYLPRGSYTHDVIMAKLNKK